MALGEEPITSFFKPLKKKENPRPLRLATKRKRAEIEDVGLDRLDPPLKKGKAKKRSGGLRKNTGDSSSSRPNTSTSNSVSIASALRKQRSHLLTPPRSSVTPPSKESLRLNALHTSIGVDDSPSDAPTPVRGAKYIDLSVSDDEGGMKNLREGPLPVTHSPHERLVTPRFLDRSLETPPYTIPQRQKRATPVHPALPAVFPPAAPRGDVASACLLSTPCSPIRSHSNETTSSRMTETWPECPTSSQFDADDERETQPRLIQHAEPLSETHTTFSMSNLHDEMPSQLIACDVATSPDRRTPIALTEDITSALVLDSERHFHKDQEFVPSSQTQYMLPYVSPHRPRLTKMRDEDDIIPSSQSQYMLPAVVSPAKRRIIASAGHDDYVASSQSQYYPYVSPRKHRAFESDDRDEIIPSSQSQYLLAYVSPKRIRIGKPAAEESVDHDVEDVIPNSQSQIEKELTMGMGVSQFLPATTVKSPERRLRYVIWSFLRCCLIH